LFAARTVVIQFVPRLSWVLVLLLALAAAGADACAPEPEAPQSLPADAAALVERIDACHHFAGEFNGDRSERDREVNATMTELRCDAVEADVVSMRTKYADDLAVLDALDAAADP
jgi:hypothetical protein